jgi:hypothetical protein
MLYNVLTRLPFLVQVSLQMSIPSKLPVSSHLPPCIAPQGDLKTVIGFRRASVDIPADKEHRTRENSTYARMRQSMAGTYYAHHFASVE